MKKLMIGGEVILPGERKNVLLRTASLYDRTGLSIPIEVIRGKLDGPTLFISAAIHGDEINGVEIIKRLLARKALKRLRGTLILAPIVNVFGFNNKSRYLPDRRDLNRSFPGSKTGSLASRVANIFMKEVVSKCTHGIDLHTGAIHRANLPQIRACLDDAETKKLATKFGVPVVIHAGTRDGSLREAARRKNVKILLYEGGQALRFEEGPIKTGLAGCLSVMKEIGMLPLNQATIPDPSAQKQVFIAKDSFWVRAPSSGSFHAKKRLGSAVKEGDLLATISDPFGGNPTHVVSPYPGIVIGLSKIPLVNAGEAMFHVATFKDVRKVKQAILDLENPV